MTAPSTRLAGAGRPDRDDAVVEELLLRLELARLEREEAAVTQAERDRVAAATAGPKDAEEWSRLGAELYAAYRPHRIAHLRKRLGL